MHLRVYSLPTQIIFPNMGIDHIRYRYDLADQVADTLNNIRIMESCFMSTMIDNGLGPHRLLSEWVRKVEGLSHDIGRPESYAICATQTFCKVPVDLRLGYLAPE